MLRYEDFEKYKDSLNKKSYSQLLSIRDNLLKEIIATENYDRKFYIEDLDEVYIRNNKKLSFVCDYIVKAYDRHQSDIEDYEQKETICVRCKQKSKNYRYCPYCNYRKL